MSADACLFAECSLTRSMTFTGVKVEVTGHQLRSGMAATFGNSHIARSGLNIDAFARDVAASGHRIDTAKTIMPADTIDQLILPTDQALQAQVASLARDLSPLGIAWLRIVEENRRVAASGKHGRGTRRHRINALVASTVGPRKHRHRFHLSPEDPDKTLHAVGGWARHVTANHPPPQDDPHHMPLVFEPDAAAILLHELIGHPLESDLAGEAGLALGQVIVPSGLSAEVNSPLLKPNGVDCEGAHLVTRTVLDRGRIVALLTDARHATDDQHHTASGFRESYTHRTIPRMHAMAFFAGEDSVPSSDLLHDIRQGLLIKRLRCGAFNPLAKTAFLLVEEACEITNGRRGRPVGPFVLSSTASQMRNAISAIGDTVSPCLQIDRCVKAGQSITVRHAAPSLRLDPIAHAT